MYKISQREKLREKVRERDNYTCQLCFKKWKKGKRKFDVHHTDIKIEGKKAFFCSNNYDFSKMITLCHKCHLNLPHIKKKMGISYENLDFIRQKRLKRFTYREIGKLLGCTYQNIQILCKKYKIYKSRL